MCCSSALNLQRFDASVEKVKTLTKRPTDDEFLELYALFKQANFGDNNTGKIAICNVANANTVMICDRATFSHRCFFLLISCRSFFRISTVAAKPGVLDLKGKAKWNAWNGKKGMSGDQAREEYIAFVETLYGKYA